MPLVLSLKKEKFDRIVSGESTQLLSALLPTDVSKSLRYVVGRYSHEKIQLSLAADKALLCTSFINESIVLKIRKDNRPLPHYASVSKHKEMRTRLGWTISCKSLYFVHSSLELVPLFTGMRERSIECLEGLYCDKVEL